MDERGFIVTNEYMETRVPGVWALGDIVGKYLLKHSANLEAAHVAYTPSIPMARSPSTTMPCPTPYSLRPRWAASV